MVNGVLWMEVVIFAVFVALRLYTRHQILNAVGIDDYLCCVALVFHLLYTIFVTIASAYGLGRLSADVGNQSIYFEAVKYEILSQFAGIMVIGVGKCAVGTFLLRIIRNKVQIAFIHVCLVITVIITLFASITAIVQCDPVERSWNQTVPGTCWIDFSNIGYTVGSWFVAMDFAFAVLPWFVVWDLNMKHKEKITVACGLSLGIFAGICGIIRTEALSGLNAQEYIYDTVPMLIWSATESTATIMCSSIPVLRPLYTRLKYGTSKGSSNENSSYQLPMYAQRRFGRSGYSSKSGGKVDEFGIASTDLGTVNEYQAQKTVISHGGGNGSDEDILRGAAGIERTDEVTVTYEAFGRKR
ncbi:uncharacterized protein DSM5745_10462 [Aspergillus mulundensis]|uniref:Rhodopsin domain-containing protein n=1 Tax=Aspergillus mulundensis TaxID=1810919 RepID=A0A3D8QJD6_9EURO|nr:Uncharacterized protein DSM5745_10462 [Aspergillus mulundensis]RDW61790.1 Uncharacterized protein DSM5745_10462 [Aspergillus mulundensis]